MQIQVNSDKNIALDSEVIGFIEADVDRVLKRHAGKLTRVEVHLSDVNSHKFGTRDKRCLIEARPARHKVLTVDSSAATVREAVGSALTKLRNSLQTFFGRLGKRRDNVTAKRSRPAVGLRRELTSTDAFSASAATGGNGHATARSTKRSPVALKETAPDESLDQARGRRKKKGVYQARRKSWPAR